MHDQVRQRAPLALDTIPIIIVLGLLQEFCDGLFHQRQTVFREGRSMRRQAPGVIDVGFVFAGSIRFALVFILERRGQSASLVLERVLRRVSLTISADGTVPSGTEESL